MKTSILSVVLLFICFSHSLAESNISNSLIFTITANSWHEIYVTHSNDYPIDYTNFSGRGYIKTSPTDTLYVDINNIYTSEVAGRYVLISGMIKQKLPQVKTFTIPHYDSDYPNITLEADSVMLNKDHLFLKFNGTLPLPLQADSVNPAALTFSPQWRRYTQYKISDGFYPDSYSFPLVEPLGGRLHISETCWLAVESSRYDYRLCGKLQLPANIQTPEGETVFIDFNQANYPDYIRFTNPKQISLSGNTGISINIQQAILDQSSTQSPGRLNNTPGWEGLYFTLFNAVMPTSTNTDNPFYSSTSLSFTSQTSDSISNGKEWLTTDSGLEIIYKGKLSQSTFLADIRNAGFPAIYDSLYVMQNNSNMEGYAKGRLQIPYINEIDLYHFTLPFDNSGFILTAPDAEIPDFTFDPYGTDLLSFKIINAEPEIIGDIDHVNNLIKIDIPDYFTNYEFVPYFTNTGIKVISPSYSSNVVRGATTFYTGNLYNSEGIPIQILSYDGSYEEYKIIEKSLTPISKLISTNLSVSPNPFDDDFHLNIENTTGAYFITLMDVTGLVVFEQLLNQNENLISARHLKPAFYTLTISDAAGNIIARRKIIKQK